jgi:SNF2 family DNA or RNA helicase
MVCNRKSGHSVTYGDAVVVGSGKPLFPRTPTFSLMETGSTGTPEASAGNPRPGLLATVRNRRAVISSVAPFQDKNAPGILHLVRVDYTDFDGPPEDQLIWQLEPSARLVEPRELPRPEPDAKPMLPREFDSLSRAVRWSALQPFLSPDPAENGVYPSPLVAPFHGAIQSEDYQLVPLVKALRMPRISLLVADDVGLGKTIETGLVLSELILRRRVRRVLILCPASLRTQWEQEMAEKFALGFDLVDRESTIDLRRRLGPDANPWRTFSKVIASYHYLKQPDVLEEFRAASQAQPGSPSLSWDLLIVDEAHNLAPSSIGDESDLSRMLGLVAPFFEHKLFLTATPHNGHTRSFTGLLERLDPVRFTRKGELTDLDKRRITEVNVRRLKREINAVTNPPRFCERNLQAIEIRFDVREETLSEAFQDFRLSVKRAVAGEGKQRQRTGAFAVEILGKRLLSCPWTFAESWHRYKLALESDTAVTDASVRAAEAAVREDTGDDLEFESRYQHAVHTVGAWLRPFVHRLKTEIATIDNALAGIELDRFTPDAEPAIDARLDGLIKWIDEKLRNGNAWRDDERLIIFTEYKTTLDYLHPRLLAEYEDPDAILTLFGNMGDKLRTAIKESFNNPTARVRILIATDAASEGLNLQETARYLLHWDIPWNPARLEQRNGRLDRHGQARDVVVHHFATEDDHDLAFLAHVIGKLENIREDIGATGELFERAFERRFIEGEDAKALENELDLTTERVRQRVELPRDQQALPKEDDTIGSRAQLDRLAAELDLRPVSMRQTLEVAMSLGFRFPVFVDTESPTRVRFATEVPPSWQGVVDDSVRHPRTRALPALTFDSSYFIETLAGGRLVFRRKPDTLLLHLAHPLFHQTFSTFARIRFQDTAQSRWIIRRGGVPAGAEAVLLLTVEELAVNDLRETFHHWVRTLALPVKEGALGALLPHRTAQEWREIVAGEIDANSARHAVAIWDDVEEDVKDLLGKWRSELGQRLKSALEGQCDAAITAENERYNSRQGEVSKLIAENTVQRIERELAELAAELQQGMLFAEDQRELLRTKEALQSELSHRTAHYQELRELLASERERITKQLLPRRYAMSGEPQVFPIALEIRLP